jgi:hypothetical protein
MPEVTAMPGAMLPGSPADAGTVRPSGSPDDARAALLALATGGWRQAVLAVAARLELCAMLGARSADLEEVCYSLGTPRQATRLFLAACEGLGLVAECDDAYRLGPLGSALRDPEGAVLADWSGAAADGRVRDALWAVLRAGTTGVASGAALGAETGATGELKAGREAVHALGLPYGDVVFDAEGTRRDSGVIRALHVSAATALAAALPVPDDGLVVEVGGQGVYAAALLARHERLRAAVVGPDRRVLEEQDVWPPSVAQRARFLAELGDQDESGAAMAVLGQTRRTLSPAALRAELEPLAGWLRGGAAIAVVGPFRLAGEARPLAPLLALLELAAGGPGWCPTVSQVADAVGASGLSVSDTLVLPEPDIAVIARRG